MDSKTRKPLKKPKKIEDMTKEQIRQAIIKKRECNAKAQVIVESLLEKSITDTYFIQCLPDINQSHFEDVIEERSIIHLCGYPVCHNSLSEKDIPKQKYRISVKTNKVYDITARKHFCSNSCYKAAMFVKRQMLTSPLWFREYEEIPKFQLLELDSIGSLGQEIDVSIIDKIKFIEKQQFTSINDFANASLQQINVDKRENSNHVVEKNNGTDRSNSPQCNSVSLRSKEPEKPENSDENKSISDNSNQVVEQNNGTDTSISPQCSSASLRSKEPEEPENSNDNNSINDKYVDNQISNMQIEGVSVEPTITDQRINHEKEKNKKSNHIVTSVMGDVVEKSSEGVNLFVINETKKEQNVLIAESIKKSQKPSVTVITIEVEKCLAEWFTLDTMLFLFGEERVKEIVSDKGACIQEYLNNYSNSIFYNSNTYDQYQELCRKLNLLEMDDRKYDVKILQGESKPLPDYSILKKESENMQIKVKAFLSGEMEFPEKDNSEMELPASSKCNNSDNMHLTKLPLVDKNAQNALRRRIVWDHLNKVLPDILRSLGLLTLSVSSNVRLLVNTFQLKANNIMFKPIQWTLIAIVIIKLLSFKDKQLEYLLEQPTAYQHMQLLLLSYKQDGGYLDRLISWLTDIDRLLDTNDTQFTVQ